MGQSGKKPNGVGVSLSAEEVVELKMIVQDDDEQAALDYLRRLRRKVYEIERRHCGDPDKLPGMN
jgi:hypothetical protein